MRKTASDKEAALNGRAARDEGGVEQNNTPPTGVALNKISWRSNMQKVYTADAPEAIGPYSQAVRTGSLLFTSGQTAIDPKTGEVVEGGIA